MKSSKSDPFVETLGVVLAVAGLTGLLVGLVAFGISGTWRNSASISAAPVGAILLAGSALLVPRLAATLLLPAGITAMGVGIMTGFIQSLNLSAPRLQSNITIIAGAVLIAASMICLLPRILRKAMVRRGAAGLNVVVAGLLALVLLVTVNYMAALYYKKHDMTKSAKFSLAPRTMEILRTLPEPVDVLFVMSPTTAVYAGNRPLELYPYAKGMLEDYAALANGRITLHHLDPVSEPEAWQRYEKDLKLKGKAELANGSVIFKTDRAVHQVKVEHMFEALDQRSLQIGKEPGFLGESEFTSALLKVTDTKKSVIYFSTGSGEMPLVSQSRKAGLSLLTKLLKDDNYDVKPLTGLANIPEDCDILAIIGPTRTLSRVEADTVALHLQNHGKLLIALEPTDEQTQPSGLEDVLRYWGIGMRREFIVIDPLGKYLGSQALVTGMHPMHEITEKIGSLTSRFFLSTVIEVHQPAERDAAGQPLPPRYAAAPIVQTSEHAYAQIDPDYSPKFDEKKDLRGPLNIAACSQERDPETPPPSPYMPPPKPNPNFEDARIVALADTTALTDEFIAKSPGNKDLALNCINWLARKTNRLGIAPKMFQAEPVYIDSSNNTAIFFGTLIGLPYLVLVIGGIVYWRRSR
ncbi:MAG TPA: GldG family protein [Planctomycetota bacterium]|nr:GldG family protein [Planctomycetota bacterium]